MHRLIIKALLYPEFHRRFNTQHVRLRRHHQTTSMRRRRSICTSSDACDTSAATSIDFVKYPNGNKPSDKSTNQSDTSMIDYGPGVAIDCTREIFASLEHSMKNKHCNFGERVPVIRDSDGSLLFAHSIDCDIGSRDSLQYYTKPVKIVIDRRDKKSTVQSVVHTSTAQMTIGGFANADKIDSISPNKGSPPDNSEFSVYNERIVRANMACEDLVHLDASMAIKSGKAMELNQKLIDERHSMPTLFVGNRFNCSSLTEVFIPSYRDKMDLKSIESASNTFDRPMDGDENQRNSNISVATTHSSSIDIAPIMPAPDQLSAELLYNPNGTPPDSRTPYGSPRNDKNSSEFVIKPPSMFGTNKTLSKEFKLKPIHNAMAIKTDLKCGQPTKTSEKVRPHEMKKCGCCTESPCISQRSSDSGMAGSYTIQLTPETPLPNAHSQYDQNEHIFPDIEQRLNGLLHSQSSHNFGRFDQNIPFADDNNNHDSGQYGYTEESESEPNRDSAAVRNLFELSSSQDTVKRKSRCHSVEPQLLDQIESNENDDDNECSNDNTDNDIERTSTDEMKAIYKTGLYAHWWKKEQLPSGMLKDILRMKLGRESNSMSCQSTDSRGSGKAFLFTHTHTQKKCISFRACFAH